MKAGIAQEIKGRLYRRILALSNVHASCSYSLFGDEFILSRKLVEVVILAACKQEKTLEPEYQALFRSSPSGNVPAEVSGEIEP